MTKGEYAFRAATTTDVQEMAALINAAYGHYVERIGILPRPMTDDYADVIANRRVTVGESHGAIVGVVVLAVDGEGFLIDNVAVDPPFVGRASERPFLSSPKPKPGGRGSILFICTRTRR